MSATREQKIWMYRMMVLSRLVEETIEEIYMEGKKPAFHMAKGPIPGEMHLSNGQEPCAVGVCAHLHDYDVVTAYHRPHHIAIAKGVNLKRMMAEIFGKSTGLSGGRGGHMHLFDPAVNFSCAGIVAQGLPTAVGAALSRKLQNKPGVAVAYLGEGAANAGAFHESLNMAGLWKLPVIFVIEDNSWGISVAKDASTAVPRNDVRAAGYNMPGIYVEGNNPDKIFEVAKTAIQRARDGEGPTLIELETSRLAGHFMGDAEQYRPEGEKEALAEKDPILVYKNYLLSSGQISKEDDERIRAEVSEMVTDAVQFARDSAYPDLSEAYQKVFI